MRIRFFISLFSLCLLLSFNGKAQVVSISGVVKNASTGEAQRNVTVYESGSGIGTITNNEGYYRLLLNPGKQRLEISNAGFHKYSSAFNLLTDTLISVELLPLELTQDKNLAEMELRPDLVIGQDSGKVLSKRNK